MTNDSLQLSLFVPDDAEPPAAVEARRLRPLQQNWTLEALSREFLLSSADLAQVRLCRGAHNRLGFALHLALLRFLHVVLPTFDLIPEPILHFISLQLDVNPAVLASYATRAQTRDDHLAQIRTYLGVRPYTAADTDALLAYLIQRALHRDDQGVLIAEAEAWLRRAQILFPALSTLQRLVSQARTMAEESLQQTILAQLDTTHLAALDALLDRSSGRRSSTLAWLKEAAPHASVPAILALLRKRAAMQALHVLQVDVSALNRNRVRQFAQLGRLYYAPTLRRFSTAKRATLLVCVCHDLDQQITDDIVEMLDVLIGRIFRMAEQERDALFAQQGKAINAHLHLFRTVARIVLDPSVPDDHIRPLTFMEVPEARLQQAVADSAVLVQPQDFNVFAFLAPKYGHLRTFLGAVVHALPFTGTAAARPVLDALAFLRHLDSTKPKWRKLPPDTPLAFVDDRWYGAVCPADGTIDHRMWLLCLAEQIRRRLRSSDLLVPGSRQHRAWDSSCTHPPPGRTASRVGL
jgi:TnpA family transposase